MSRKSGHKLSTRGVLTAVFATIMLGAGADVAFHALFDDEPPAPPDEQPCVTVDEMADVDPAHKISVFGTDARHAATPYISPYYLEWRQEVRRQQSLLNSSEGRREFYDTFLSKFDRYKDECIAKMAQNVNSDVLRYVTYVGDQELYHKPEYWAAPVQTATRQQGDCEDYAILQYAIMRHLGVPEERLMMAMVKSDADAAHMNHAVLILNIAPDDAPPDYVVLNDGGPVVRASDYEPGGPEVPGWSDPYTLYYLINNGDLWHTGELLQGLLPVPLDTASAAPAGPAAPRLG